MLRIVRKALLFRLAALTLAMLLPLLLAEAALRFLPVNEGLGTEPVDAANPVLHFTPNRDRVWSRGWSFSAVNRVHVNNAGFVNDRDYDARDRSPLLAIVGDSYVEAAMLPYAETAPGRLATELDGRARVYTFGASGAPLSQYLVYADHARRVYRPDALAVFIVGNDFDESWLRRGGRPGFHYFAERAGGAVDLVRVDLSISPFREAVRRSALAMYLVTQLEITALPARLTAALRGERDTERFAGNTARDLAADRLADGRRAIELFLDRLPGASGLPPERIALVVDAVRPDLYEGGNAESYFGTLRDELLRRAGAAGFETIDLAPRFADDYARNGARFESPEDGHWNARGHRLVFEALRDSRIVAALDARRAQASVPAAARCRSYHAWNINTSQR